MKIGFVVNDVATEKPVYTTTGPAMAATQAGHEVHLVGTGSFAYEPDGTLSVLAHGTQKNHRSLERYLEEVQKEDNARQLPDEDFDVVMLRNDPADDAAERPWAPAAPACSSWTARSPRTSPRSWRPSPATATWRRRSTCRRPRTGTCAWSS